jgi:hypothetical protein
LSEHARPDPLRLALDIADAALADRLAELLAGVPGLRLVVRVKALMQSWCFQRVQCQRLMATCH